MIIRIEFTDCESQTTKGTMETLYGSPSGTCLSSSKSCPLCPKAVREEKGLSVGFWYLDIDILNKHYCGVMSALSGLLTYPGVAKVDILPFEREVDGLSEEQWYELLDALVAYKDGPIAKY
jgi:hypothetical protein